jgi:SAM-dependent methyltransferase
LNLLPPTPSLAEPSLLAEQAGWLAPARSALLRRVGIGHKRRVLDIGAGYGIVTAELARRAAGRPVAFDLQPAALAIATGELDRVSGDAAALPFAAESFDLVFSQCALLWMRPLAAVMAEIRRVLQTRCELVALEPDYGGLIEHPPEAAVEPIWLAALARAGADPLIGRRLPGILDAAGFAVTVRFLDQLEAPLPRRLDFLRGLPLTGAESQQLQAAQRAAAGASGWATIAHLPFFLITARRRD